MTKLTREIAEMINDQVAGAVNQAVTEMINNQVIGAFNRVITEQIMPSLVMIDQAVRAVDNRVRMVAAVLTSAGLDQGQLVVALTRYLLPNEAQLMADRLTADGYALVPVTGPALDAVVDSCTPQPEPDDNPVRDVHEAGMPWTEQTAAAYAAKRETMQGDFPALSVQPFEEVNLDEAPEPGSFAQAGGAEHVHLLAQRADERLAQANRDPEDSWREHNED